MKHYFLFLLLLFGLNTNGQTDGNFDSLFAAKGWTALHFLHEGNSSNEDVKQVLIQADGKYILVISAGGGTVLARYNADGSQDYSYGINGFSSTLNIFPRQAVLSNGKIIVAGSVVTSSHQDFAVARYNPDGSPDNTFGTNGISIVSFSSWADYATSLAIQADGKIVLAGTVEPWFETIDIGLVRLNSDGSLDNSFGVNGKIVEDLGSEDDCNAVAIMSNGNIIVAGVTAGTISLNGDFALVCYTPGGTLDNSFVTNGMITTDFGGYDIPNAAIIQTIAAEDKILVAGLVYSDIDGSYDFALARYNSDGTLDGSFGTGGKIVSDTSDAMATAVAIQRIGTEDKILVTGGIINTTTSSADFLVARYNSNGTEDNNFGTNGIVTTSINSSSYANCVAIQGDGKIVVAGSTTSDMTEDFGLVRYTLNGVLDISFGAGGSGISTGYYPVGLPSEIRNIAVQADGKIVVAGDVNTFSQADNFGVARYNSDGTLDAGFGTGAVVTTDFNNLSDHAVSIAIQADGKIVVAGEVSTTSPGYSFGVARYNADGTADETFGTGGKATTALTTSFNHTTSVMIQRVGTDDKIVVVGYGESGFENNDLLLARYNSDGTADNSFGTGGLLITDFGSDDIVNAAAIQKIGTEDKIVVAGLSYGIGWDFLIVRYNNNGSLDQTFGTGGKITTDFGSSDDEAYAIAIQGDGKIVVGGRYNMSGPSDFAIARYNTDGTLDNTFNTGGGGKVITDFGSDEMATAVTLQSDGKILAAGGIYSSRYLSDGNLDNSYGTGGKAVAGYGYNGYIISATWSNGRLYAGGGIASNNNAGLVAAFKASAIPPGLPVVSINDVTVYESPNGTDNNTAVLTFSLNKPGTSLITVNYATQDVTATSKGRYVDYKATKGAISFSPGNTTATISVTIYKDNIEEGDETFNVNLSLTKQMAKLATIGKGTGVVTIKNGTGTVSFGKNILTAFDMPTQKEPAKGKLSVTTYPNPSFGHFTLQLQSASTAPASIRIMNASGKMIETKTSVAANSSVQLGYSYRPGVYYAEIVQGTEKLVIKLVKQ